MTSNIIQITDTHLFKDKNSVYNSSNPYNNLQNTIDHIKKNIDKADLIVVTGDCSQDSSLGSYENLKSLLLETKIKFLLIPGNHDDLNNMSKVFELSNDREKVDYEIEFNDWYIYFLNTAMFPHVHGELTKSQLESLNFKLQKSKNINAVIFMHHHPIEVKSLWMDKLMLKQKEEFNLAVKKNPQVKAVFFGHIHHVFEKSIGDVLYASGPSTIFQVVPNKNEFQIDKLTPGYRLIKLEKDKLTSQVIWVT